MIPEAYFYLVDLETDEPLAIFSADECRSGIELHMLEGRIRAEHHVDDVTSGLALRDSASNPLSAAQLAEVVGRQHGSTC